MEVPTHTRGFLFSCRRHSPSLPPMGLLLLLRADQQLLLPLTQLVALLNTPRSTLTYRLAPIPASPMECTLIRQHTSSRQASLCHPPHSESALCHSEHSQQAASSACRAASLKYSLVGLQQLVSQLEQGRMRLDNRQTLVDLQTALTADSSGMQEVQLQQRQALPPALPLPAPAPLPVELTPFVLPPGMRARGTHTLARVQPELVCPGSGLATQTELFLDWLCCRYRQVLCCRAQPRPHDGDATPPPLPPTCCAAQGGQACAHAHQAQGQAWGAAGLPLPAGLHVRAGRGDQASQPGQPEGPVQGGHPDAAVHGRAQGLLLLHHHDLHQAE